MLSLEFLGKASPAGRQHCCSNFFLNLYTNSDWDFRLSFRFRYRIRVRVNVIIRVRVNVMIRVWVRVEGVKEEH